MASFSFSRSTGGGSQPTGNKVITKIRRMIIFFIMYMFWLIVNQKSSSNKTNISMSKFIVYLEIIYYL